MSMAHITIQAQIFSRVIILIVDHALRDNSLKQAQEIAQYWKNIGIEALVLSPDKKFKHGNMLHWAREIRYNSLSKWCKNNQILHLLVAHNANDNAENFLIRLNRKSGTKGLSYMKQVYYYKQVRIIKPLLQIYRDEIIKYHSENELPLWHDPTNDNYKYQRIKWRKILNSNYGWNPKDINRISKACSQIENKIKNATEQAIMHIRLGKNYSSIDAKLFNKQTPEIQSRILNKMILFVSGENYPPRYNVIQKFLNDTSNKKRSVGKCLVYNAHSRLWVTKHQSST